MEYLLAVGEGIGSGFSFLLRLFLIIFPLMIILAFAEDLQIIKGISLLLKPLGRPLTLSSKALLPLLVGLTFGLSYGAGVIIKYAEEGSISKRDMGLVGIFLAVCHSIIEDTLIFMALGAQFFWIFLFRLFLALLLVAIVGRTYLFQ